MSAAIGRLERPAAAWRAASSSPGVRRTRALIVWTGGVAAPSQLANRARRLPLSGCTLSGFAGLAKKDGGLRARFGGIEEGTKFLEGTRDLLQVRAASCRERPCGGSSD